jgi:hypothetical protein
MTLQYKLNFIYACYIPFPSSLPWLYLPNYVCWRVQIIKLFICNYLLSPATSSLFRPNILLAPCSQHPVFSTLFSAPCFQHPVLSTLFSAPCFQHPVLSTLFSAPCSQTVHAAIHWNNFLLINFVNSGFYPRRININISGIWKPQELIL